MKFDFDSVDRPLFLQIADEIKNGILEESIGEEEQIPSSTEISIAYKINPATVNKGVNLLVNEGIIYKKRGIGMFVKEGAKAKLKKRAQAEFCEKFILPLLREADKIDIAREEIIDYIKQEGRENG